VAGLAIERFDERPEVPPGSSLFAVVEGEGAFLLLTETDGGETAGGEQYHEIFRSRDARPVAESARFVYLIRIDVADDLDHDAFNEWYDHKHVPEVAPAGLRRGKRYTSELPGFPYMALYDMDARDTLTSEALQKVRGFYQFTPQITALERTVLERVE
jgi:hypothetical protein